jgi:hypothetical protein
MHKVSATMTLCGNSTPVLTQRVGEVALWCSLQELTAFHQDSAEEARRRELLKEANTLLATVKYKREGWLQRLLPGEERWTRAMNLLREADPDTLAPLENQLRSPKLKPPNSIGSSYSEESRQEMVDAVIDLRLKPYRRRQDISSARPRAVVPD